ncbi:cytochrome P450 [Streptomyces sp. NPDC058961]|uniref:cytochrome P450 n=1 Tax=Streptomyces sp. NPDC058961 TaxID=3346680 RepID=UPI0036CA1700
MRAPSRQRAACTTTTSGCCTPPTVPSYGSQLPGTGTATSGTSRGSPYWRRRSRTAGPRPGRFTPEEAAQRPRLAHIPFGFGPRGCEGAQLATVEAQLALAVLLRRLRFAPEPGHEVVPVERFVLWAADDIRMTVSPRH